MAGNFIPYAISTIKQGLSGRAGLAAARAAGVAPRDATWFRVLGEMRRALTTSNAQLGAPLNRRPLGSEIATMSTKNATGFMQHVGVIVRDRMTGLVAIRDYTVRANALISRGRVIDRALNAYAAGAADEPERYPFTVLGAVYLNTYVMAPTL